MMTPVPTRRTLTPLLLIIAIVWVMALSTSPFATAQNNNNNNNNANTTPPPPPPKPSVTLTRTYIPLSCDVQVNPDALVTFHYVANLVTPQRTVGDIFDETAEYHPITLRANSRNMLAPLASGMQGACVDERRTIVIPHNFFTFDSVPAKTDIVFFVHIISIEPYSDIFEQIDVNNDNCITLEEFKTYVKNSGRVPTDELVNFTAARLFRQNDANGDGIVTCTELGFTSSHSYCELHSDIKCLETARNNDEFASWLSTFVRDNDII